MNPQPEFNYKGSDNPRQDHATAKRRLRGMEIAATVKIGKNAAGYIVPSKSGTKFYLVKLNGAPSCTCPDFVQRQKACKHCWAVLFTIQRDEPAEDPPEMDPEALSRAPYRDWPTYNKGQFAEGRQFPKILRALCDTVPQPPQTTGRPRLPLGDMVYAAALKINTCLSGRRAMSDIWDAHESGRLTRAPSLASVFRYLENHHLIHELETLIVKSALPLRSVETEFAIDASGFSTSVKANWNEHKWGRGSEDENGQMSENGNAVFVKGHVCSGVKTNVITAAVATPGNANDYPFFIPLLETTAEGFPVSCISADKAYLGEDNLLTAERVGAQVRIPFKDNSVPSSSKKRDPVWGRHLQFFNEHRDEFLEQYHKRSNVETTFSMIKARFGGWVRSKTLTAQLNEVLLKILCHNIAVLAKAKYTLGIDFKFGPHSAGGDHELPMAA